MRPSYARDCRLPIDSRRATVAAACGLHELPLPVLHGSWAMGRWDSGGKRATCVRERSQPAGRESGSDKTIGNLGAAGKARFCTILLLWLQATGATPSPSNKATQCSIDALRTSEMGCSRYMALGSTCPDACPR